MVHFASCEHEEGPSCGRAGCKQAARWLIYLVLRPPAPFEGRIRASTGLQVCDEHRGQTAFTDIVDERGWERIAEELDAIDRMEPSRELSGLEFEPIS